MSQQKEPSGFSPALQKSIEGYLTRYETKRSSILPILHAIQDEKGWISEDDILRLEADYGLSAVDVREVVTFYTMYRSTPPSQPNRFEICQSISCWLMGADETMDAVRNELEHWQQDGKPLPFELHPVECLGQCGYAPSTLINQDRHNNVTPEKALHLLREYSEKTTKE